MASNLSKRLEKLELALAQRTQGPKVVRSAVIADGDEVPAEGADELLICRVIVSPLLPCRRLRLQSLHGSTWGAGRSLRFSGRRRAGFIGGSSIRPSE
jgi:hypothetical protein